MSVGHVDAISPYISTLRTVAEGVGVLGLVRFLLGYYLVLVKDRKRVGCFGPHAVFALESAVLVPLSPSVGAAVFPSQMSAVQQQMAEKEKQQQQTYTAGLFRMLGFFASEEEKAARRMAADETKYKAMFLSMLSNKNFYFSYSMDLTRTMQQLMINQGLQRPKSMFVWNWHLLRPLKEGLFASRPGVSFTRSSSPLSSGH